MVKYLCIAAIIGAGSAVCRAGDFGDPLPLDQRVAALEKKVAELERLAKPVQTVAGPVVSPFATTVTNVPTQSFGCPTTFATPSVSYTVGSADPVVYMTSGGQTVTCVNGQCSTSGGGAVEYQRPGLFQRIFRR
jgi:hypothetical protein